MLRKYRILLLIVAICSLEGIIYLWSLWTLEDSDFLFGKAARISGRASAALNLLILFDAGYYGLKKIYSEEKKRDLFRILITLFAINHLIHFFYIFQNFNTRSEVLAPADHVHGIYTFVLILFIPILIWSFKNLNRLVYYSIIIYIFSSTYFMQVTFYGKISDEKPHYFHQIGIVIMIIGLIYLLYRVFRERSIRFTANI